MENQLRKLCLWWVYLAGILLLIIILTTVIDISASGIDRIVRNYGYSVEGLPGYEDLVRLLVSSIALMFFPWTQLERGHISVEFFTDSLSTKWLMILDKIWLSLTFCLVIFLMIMMYFGMLESKGDNALSRILGWEEWRFYIPGLISLFLWALVLIYQILFEKRGHVHA
ncbi:TRAP transporter small permease [Sulfurospirillum sp. 1612]|uniref:TRAP transporter small permease n=1 Tax=Sulfurospirillum sp. 1612 TaxID=3094835 RepID=UPI002F9596E3